MKNINVPQYNDVINFWFKELTASDWFSSDDKLDAIIKKRFELLHSKVSKCECYSWRTDPKGRLAEIIVLDQFSRNMFRGTPKAFEYDSLALALSQEAIENNTQDNLSNLEKQFLYMPFMHSESDIIHEEAVKLFSRPGLENALDFEFKHKKIINKFHRYPHRNNILNRESTIEELEFLKTKNSSF